MAGKAPFPHCDSNVLHAPGECEYCDNYPELQADRQLRRINFTGYSMPGLETCPSELKRPLEKINKWGGNRAYPKYVIREDVMPAPHGVLVQFGPSETQAIVFPNMEMAKAFIEADKNAQKVKVLQQIQKRHEEIMFKKNQELELVRGMLELKDEKDVDSFFGRLQDWIKKYQSWKG